MKLAFQDPEILTRAVNAGLTVTYSLIPGDRLP